MPMNARKAPPFTTADPHEAWWSGLDPARRTQIMFEACGGDLARMPDTADEWWAACTSHDRQAIYQWYGLGGGAPETAYDPNLDEGPAYARGGFFEDPLGYLATIVERFNTPRAIQWTIAGLAGVYILFHFVIPVLLGLAVALLQVLGPILLLFIFIFVFWAPGAAIEYLDREIKRGQQRRHDRQTIRDIKTIKDAQPRE